MTPEKLPRPNVSGTVHSSEMRRLKNQIFLWVCIATALVSVAVLAILLVSITIQGLPTLSWSFVRGLPNYDPRHAGIGAALVGTVMVSAVCALFALPLGVGTAIFLEEFKPTNPLLQRLHNLVQLNIANLAGVPSVVYGIIGTAAFVYMFAVLGRGGSPAIEFGVTRYDQVKSLKPRTFLRLPVSSPDAPLTIVELGQKAFYGGKLVELNVIQRGETPPKDPEKLAITVYAGAKASRVDRPKWYYVRLPLGKSVLAGGLTLMLVVLPVVIIAAQESLRAVPFSLREAALGLGGTRWQVVWNVTLPAAIPGIMTGSILSMSRAMGEAAPILMISGALFVSTFPEHLMDKFTIMPLQIYSWIEEHREGFHPLAASAIIVLLLVMLAFNAVAILVRQKLQKPLS
jgi:phosphate transport system permease protein